jgi:hypothetical protein
MQSFIRRHAAKVLGVLTGFDRLVFRGSLRQISFVEGMKGFLWHRQVLLKDFKEYALETTKTVRESSLRAAEAAGRPVVYLPSGKTNKEQVALEIAAKDGVTDGLICVLECVEPCMTYEVHRSRERKRLELQPRASKCKFLYHYMVDPVFGLMNARIQTWFPFSVQLCINGREWLARAMDRVGLGYERRDNCFARLDDVEKAQRLMDRQLELAWPKELARIARTLNPAHGEIFEGFKRKGLDVDYYWSVYQSEWATDVMFQDARSLAELYRPLVLHGITTYSSGDVMRFLGRKVHGGFRGEVVSDFKDRAEGIRLKHSVGKNSVKVYDKQGSVLRVETTINEPNDFKVFRTKEGDDAGEKEWRRMRRGVADLHRRAQVSQASNDRYLEALAAVDTSTSLGDLFATINRPVTWKGARVRGLRPWAPDDLALLRAVSRGEFCVSGFRNRDVQAHLYTSAAASREEARRRSGRVSRLLRLLRAHGLIRKLPKSHRYKLSDKGRQVATAILAAHGLSLEQINRAVA